MDSGPRCREIGIGVVAAAGSGAAVRDFDESFSLRRFSVDVDEAAGSNSGGAVGASALFEVHIPSLWSVEAESMRPFATFTARQSTDAP